MWATSGAKALLHKSKLEDVQRRFPLTSKLNYLNEEEYDLAKVAFSEAVRKDFEKELAEEDEEEEEEDEEDVDDEEEEEDDEDDSSDEDRTSRSGTPTPSQKRRVEELFSSSEDEDRGSKKRARREESHSASSDSQSGSSSDEDGEDSSSDNSVTFISETRVSEKLVKEKLLDREGLGPYYSDKYVQPVLAIVRENGGNPEELLQGWFIRIRTRTTSENSVATDVSYLDEQGHVSKSRPEIIRSLGLISSKEAQNEAVASK